MIIETLNDKYLRLFTKPYVGWNNYQRFYNKKGGNMEALHPYYQARLEDATITSVIVFGSIVAAIILIAVAVIH